MVNTHFHYSLLSPPGPPTPTAAAATAAFVIHAWVHAVCQNLQHQSFIGDNIESGCTAARANTTQ